MILDLFWTKQGLEHTPPAQGGGMQQRLEYLLQSRERMPSRGRPRRPLSQSETAPSVGPSDTMTGS